MISQFQFENCDENQLEYDLLKTIEVIQSQIVSVSSDTESLHEMALEYYYCLEGTRILLNALHHIYFELLCFRIWQDRKNNR